MDGRNEMTEQEFRNIVKSLEETVEALQKLVSELPEKDLRWKPSETEFSVLEHVCHLRDIEEEGYAVRIQKLLTEKEPFLPDIDGAKLAEERSYNSQESRPALLGFARARKANVRVLEHLSLDQLKRSGTFEKVGSVSLERLLLMMLEHDQEHLRELSDLSGRLTANHYPRETPW
jgi:DinB family protein